MPTPHTTYGGQPAGLALVSGLGPVSPIELGCVRAGGRLSGHSGFVARFPSDGTIVESLGSRPFVTHNRIVGRLSIAWTRQVTVMQSFCGVDVSKDWLDVFGPDGSEIRVPNTAEGIGQIAALCRVGAEVIVVMEASGGGERAASALRMTVSPDPPPVRGAGRTPMPSRCCSARAKHALGVGFRFADLRFTYVIT